MRAIDILRRSGRNLSQAKGRTILTSLAIGVGAFTIALAMAAGNGGRAYLDSVVSGAGDMRSIQVYAQQDTEGETDDSPQKISEIDASETEQTFKSLSPSDREKIAKIDGVEKAMPIFGVNPYSVQANGSDEYEATMGVQYDATKIDLTAGKLGADNEITPGKIVLPHRYVESFDFENAEAAVGKTVTATFMNSKGEKFTHDFVIQAVDAEPTSPLAFYQDEFRISNKDGETISKKQQPADQPEEYFSVMVTAEQGADVDEVKEAIIKAGDYEAETFAEMRSAVMEMVNIVQYGLIGFGLLAIIASVFGVINTQYISVLERTQQIGLMKALGARRKDIGKMFRYEAAWIGFLGGVLGVVLAYLVTLLNPVIEKALELEAGTQLLRMDWLMSGILVIGLMLVAIISGWFPSRKAAKLDPIEALRTE